MNGFFRSPPVNEVSLVDNQEHELIEIRTDKTKRPTIAGQDEPGPGAEVFPAFVTA